MKRIVLYILLSIPSLLAQPTAVVHEPQQGAQSAEFSAPVLKISIAGGDGSIRIFADNAGNYDDLVFYTNVRTAATVTVQMPPLSPGEYNLAVMTGTLTTSELFGTNITFSVTNRLRTVPRYAMTILPGGSNTIPAR